MLARETLDMHRLPAWQSAGLSPEKVAALCNYPWNGLLAG
jgi:hypothetical protein